jgi:hypothetical protein
MHNILKGLRFLGKETRTKTSIFYCIFIKEYLKHYISTKYEINQRKYFVVLYFKLLQHCIIYLNQIKPLLRDQPSWKIKI